MGIIDPRPGLRREYHLALARLKGELGQAPTRKERRRVKRQIRRLNCATSFPLAGLRTGNAEKLAAEVRFLRSDERDTGSVRGPR
jgi:hypothetical protein